MRFMVPGIDFGGSAVPLAPDAIAGLVVWLRADSNVLTPDGTLDSPVVDSAGTNDAELSGFSTAQKLSNWTIDVPSVSTILSRSRWSGRGRLFEGNNPGSHIGRAYRYLSSVRST